MSLTEASLLFARYAVHGHNLYSDMPAIYYLPKTFPRATLHYLVIYVSRKGCVQEEVYGLKFSKERDVLGMLAV